MLLSIRSPPAALTMRISIVLPVNGLELFTSSANHPVAAAPIEIVKADDPALTLKSIVLVPVVALEMILVFKLVTKASKPMGIAPSVSVVVPQLPPMG